METRLAALAAAVRAPRDVCAAALLLDTWRAAVLDLAPRAGETCLCETSCAYWGFRLVHALPCDSAVHRVVGLAAEMCAVLLGDVPDAAVVAARGFHTPTLELFGASRDTALCESVVDAMVAAAFVPLHAIVPRLCAVWRALGETDDVFERCARIGLFQGIESHAAPPGSCAARPALRRLFDR